MKQFVKNGYSYSELSDSAKEKVKEWYLNDPTRNDLLTDVFENDLKYYYFKNSDLKVEWSLSSCQGDGVNVYGKLNVIKDILKAADLTDKQKKQLSWYMTQYDYEYCDLPVNRRYTYCNVDSVSYADDLTSALEYDSIRSIDSTLIKQLEDLIVQRVKTVCRDMEKYGYKYLYEADDSEVEECCDANEWYFDSNGKFIHDYDYMMEGEAI